MSNNKKYYYLKLKDTFYNAEDVKLLESMENGYEYSSLYLKLCLLSLKGEGQLLYKNRIPYNTSMLSTITGHKKEIIEYAIPILQKLNMLILLDNGTIFIDDIQNLVGHGSTEAERKAIYRDKLKELESGTLSLESPGQFPLEKEIEKEKDKEIEKNKAYHPLASLLLEKLRNNDNKFQVKYKDNNIINRWSNDIRLLCEVDKREYGEIEKVITWCQDNDFWKGVIQSGSSLRKQFTKLYSQSKKKKKKIKNDYTANDDWEDYKKRNPNAKFDS